MTTRGLLLFAVAGIVFAFTIWASTQPVAETAVTEGQVMPVGSVLKVQHLEGGIVQDVLVEDGDMVTQGQILIHLDPSSLRQKKGQLATRRAF